MSVEAPSTPQPTTGEPVWSLGTALLFVAIWVLLTYLVQSTFFSVAALLLSFTQGSTFDDELRGLFSAERVTAQAVGVAACTTVTWFATFTLIGRLLRSFPRPSVLRALGLNPPTPTWSLLAAIPVGIALLVVGEVIMQLLAPEPDANPIKRLFESPVGVIVMTFLTIVVAPIAEETFFRGFVFPPMARRLSLGNAMALNGGLFALVHLMTYQDAKYLPPIFLLGFVLSGLRAWTGSIRPCIIAHFFFNGISLAGYFLLPESASSP